MDEKDNTISNGDASSERGQGAQEFRNTEAAEMYSNMPSSQKFGYVSRELKSRHIQFIALGGTIGTGLFLGIGIALAQAGPLSVLLGYIFTGFATFCLMQCLGEMATWSPLPGAIPHFCARYVDDAMGFAVGWNNWYSAALAVSSEISAASIVIGFWNDQISPAAWITIMIFVVVVINIYSVRIYGESEFWFVSIKIIAIVGLLILALVLDLGGGPNHDRLGFRYWKHPGAMKEYMATGDLGRFLGLFSTFINAAFSYSGVETVAVAAGETENPSKNIPIAVRRVFWRILAFYILGSLAIGVLVPYNDNMLLNAQALGLQNGAASPWVIAIYRAGIPVLPSIINAVILTAAVSSVSAFLYVGSRYLYSLAQERQAPKFLLQCSKNGVPYWCVGITALMSLLAYMSVSASSDKVFIWFYNITSISSLVTWASICVAYLKFYYAMQAQGISRAELPFKSACQPYAAWFALIYFLVIMIFNGFAVFIRGNWNISNFMVSYIGIPIFFALYIFWKVFKRTSWRKSVDVDLRTGRVEIDEEEPKLAPHHEQASENIFRRMWFYIA